MSTQDLSLLTGEQRELMNKYSALLVNPDMDLALLDEHEFGAFFSTLRGGEPYSIELTSSWVNRLIAARAENQRLQQEILVCPVCEMSGGFGHEPDRDDCTWCSLSAEVVRAEAENKRKDEVITKLIDAAEQGRNLLRQVAEVGSLAGRRGAHGRADAIDAVLKEAAALLQSEKGVNMPKVTGEVCPKCLSLTHFEDIELPSYRVLGVPEPPEYKRIEVCPECGWQSEKGGE